jgi:hypothetical protein
MQCGGLTERAVRRADGACSAEGRQLWSYTAIHHLVALCDPMFSVHTP